MRMEDYLGLVALCTTLRLSLSLCPPKTNLAVYTSSPLCCRLIVRTNLDGTIFGLPSISERSTNLKVPLFKIPSISFRFASSNRLLRGSRGEMISVSNIRGLATKGSQYYAWIGEGFSLSLVVFGGWYCNSSVMDGSVAGLTWEMLKLRGPVRSPWSTRTFFSFEEITKCAPVQHLSFSRYRYTGCCGRNL
jgi:hypothetical protein